MIDDRPLVSFCVMNFNQMRHIADALAGAFAQTYRPLEIVISDDGSTDGSWEYILSAVKEFRDKVDRGEVAGGVTVVTSRNEVNLGGVVNWQKLGELANGKLCIKADGDDISLPERTTRIVEEWRKAGMEKVKVIIHNAWKLDADNKIVGWRDGDSARSPFGAVMAFAKDCFDGFPAIKNNRCVDDVPFCYRGLALGNELRLDERLVLYRIGTGISTCTYDFRLSMYKWAPAHLAALDEIIYELEELARNHPSQRVLDLLQEVRDVYHTKKIWYGLATGESFSMRFRWYKEFAKETRSLILKLLYQEYLLPQCLSRITQVPRYFVNFWIERIKARKLFFSSQIDVGPVKVY